MNEIFAAIYTRLTAQLSNNVYDHVPQDLPETSYPFVRVDAVQPDDNGTDTEVGFIATVQIIGYSRYNGVKEINTLADNVYNVLHRFDLPDTASYGISGIRETFRRIAVQPDGLTRNSVQHYEIIFEPLPV